MELSWRQRLVVVFVACVNAAAEVQSCRDGECALPLESDPSALSLLQTKAVKSQASKSAETRADAAGMPDDEGAMAPAPMPPMEPPKAPMAPPKKTTVMIMRHCVRTPGDDGIVAVPHHHEANDYAAYGKFPTFDAALNDCTTDGKIFVKSQGEWTVKQPSGSQDGIPLPVRAIGDHVARCRSTMDSFLAGFAPGLANPADLEVTIDRLPFRWGKSPACAAKKLSAEDALKAQQDYIDANPPPPGYYETMQQLYNLLGKGTAGDWTKEPCKAGLGYGPSYPDPRVNHSIDMMPVGACQAATHLVSLLGTEAANNMTVAWGRLGKDGNPDGLGKFSLLNAYHDHIWFTNPTAAAWRAAALSKAFAGNLEAAEPGTTMYFGRKSNILEFAGVVGLSWPTTPFANYTKSGSWLRLDREGDMITASYHFPNQNAIGENGSMSWVPAVFASTGKPTISVEEYMALTNKNTIPECAVGNECPNLPGCWKWPDGVRPNTTEEIDPDEDVA